MQLYSFTYFGFAVLALACGGGQTGDLSGNSDEGGPSSGEGFCDSQKRQLAFDEVSPLGFSAEQVLAFAEGSFEAPLTWQEPGEESEWKAVGPESGQSSIRIDVARGVSAAYVTYTPKTNGEEGGPAIAANCPQPGLVVDARVDVTTEGGALAESVDTSLRASSSDFATLELTLEPEALAGAFEVTSFADPHAKLVQLALNAMLMPEGSSGSLVGTIEIDDGAVVGASQAEFAIWPGSPACAGYGDGSGIPVKVGQTALGMSGEDTLERIAATTPTPIRWLDGTETELTLTVTSEGDGCVHANAFASLGEGGAVASYPVRFALKTADGRLDGQYLGDVTTMDNDGGREIHASAVQELTPQQADQSGFHSVEVPRGADRLTVWLDVQVGAERASGSVRLSALTDPPCVTTPPPPDPSGMGSPGCAGTTVTPIEAASWGRP